MIEATPDKAPCPIEDFLRPTLKERLDAEMAKGNPSGDKPCAIPVQVGLFFDGTNNNMERDLNGRRVPVPLSELGLRKARAQARAEGRDLNDLKPAPVPPHKLDPEECSHSNVVRLFQTFPQNKTEEGYHPYYIPGVGTEFREIRELTESQDGKAFAKGGQSRIVWGLLQVLNAIHRTVYRDPLYDDTEVGQYAQSYNTEIGQTIPGGPEGGNPPPTHQAWFAPHLARLRAALAAKPKPRIPSLTLSVFGFSRGAAEAVAFCHLFDQLLDAGEFAGIAATIRFVGLFDVVASVGGVASMAQTLPVPGAFFDGHWAWANAVMQPLPACVGQGLHCIAAHELRMNFPVTRIKGNIREVYFPGVHSDVGGGYAPGEQGKGRGSQAALLSQIPLAHMYKAARLAGVPLLPFSELRTRDQHDFKVDAALARAWEAYTAALEGQGNQLARHMELFYRWRAARLATLETTASFAAASAQDRQDLREANRMLAGDLEALRRRRELGPALPASGEEGPLFGPEAARRINQWQLLRANSRTPLDAWERWALAIFEAPAALPPAVETFFDDYLHDSFAGFWMAGEMSEFEKRQKVEAVLEMKPGARSRFEARVAELATRTREAERRKAGGEALGTEDEALLKEAARGGTPYPLMSDEDAADLRSPMIVSQTATRREGGGYLIRRGHYPQNGFFLKKRRDEPERAAPSLAGLPRPYRKLAEARAAAAADIAPREFGWSEHLPADIAALRAAPA